MSLSSTRSRIGLACAAVSHINAPTNWVSGFQRRCTDSAAIAYSLAGSSLLGTAV
ncbi:Uncharacterised protein [Mycobacteroides abscessus subsp. massiliense]|nr:Uncharacterised protein [Mycobacteroides abscessus subsp. massiliense]